MLKNEEELVVMLDGIDRQQRAVLAQIEAATELARENIARMKECLSRLEAVDTHLQNAQNLTV